MKGDSQQLAMWSWKNVEQKKRAKCTSERAAADSARHREYQRNYRDSRTDEQSKKDRAINHAQWRYYRFRFGK